MKKTGHNYKTYWCKDYECYFKVNSHDSFARNVSALEPVKDMDRSFIYPTYICRDIELEQYLNEDDEIDFYLLIKDSTEENG
jgi:hypothetical protein